MSRRRRDRQPAPRVVPVPDLATVLAGQMVAGSIAADPTKVDLSAEVRDRLAAFEAATDAAVAPLQAVYEAYDALIGVLGRSPLVEAQVVGMRVAEHLRSLNGRHQKAGPGGE